MSDSTRAKVIDALAADAHRISKDHGFWAHLDPRGDTRFYVPEKVALIHTEASEIIKADRDLHDEGQRLYDLLEECADVIIRVFDLAHVISHGGARGSLGEALVSKMITNDMRPPLHGKRW